MLAQLSQWILIAALGQAAPEAALLKAAPAEVDVAVRIRGVEATRDDLLAMLKAMNPDWANMAEGTLAGPLTEFRERHGAHASKTPFIALIRLGEPGGDGGPPPFAVLVPAEDYKGVLKELSRGKDPELKHQDGDYDAFEDPDGQGTLYAAKAEGIVAFGNSKGLIADFAKRGGKTLDSVLTGSSAKSFLGGDIGLYVNAASLTKRYSDQIDQARQGLMAALDQAAQQAGTAAQMQFVKDLYGAMFDSLKNADALTLDLDLAEKGLHVTGFLKVKADSEAAKPSEPGRSGVIATLGKYPADASAYVYMNMQAKTFEQLQSMSLKMLNPEGKASPELEKAKAELHGLGTIESIGSVSMEKGMRSIIEIVVNDPQKYIDATVATFQAMKGGTGLAKIYKEIKVEGGVQTYEGLKFTHLQAIVDVDELAKLSGNNPQQADVMKMMLGDGNMGYWYGTDGKRLFQVTAPKWEDAKAELDAYFAGKNVVGQTPGFKAVRSEMPEQARFLMLFSTQSLVRMMASGIASVAKNPNLKPPDDMPKDPAYLGASVTSQPSEGYEFHLVVPSAVGTVVAKGVIPMIQGLAGAGANQ